MHDVATLADRLRAVLTDAHGRAPAREAIEHWQRDDGLDPHAVRTVLDSVLRDAQVVRGLAWPTIEAARTILAETDAAIDRALIAAANDAPMEALARDLVTTGRDPDRVARSAEIVWRHLSPPAARAGASFVDLLRAHELPSARATLYRFLVDHGVDIRGALADDVWLDADGRIAVLGAWASRVADAGRQRAVSWHPDPRMALARALADWPAHVTHPRQLLFAYRLRANVRDALEYRSALQSVARWPLQVEVRAWLEAELSRESIAMRARPVGAGRFECARCGGRQVAVVSRRLVDPEDPPSGVETEFQCPACGMRYFSSWHLNTLDHDAPGDPLGWFGDPVADNARSRS